MSCSECNTIAREISGEECSKLYQKLKPYLKVIESFGCYTPSRNKKQPGNHEDWPRHHWKGPGTFPLVLTFDKRKKGRQPTYWEFCLAYSLKPIEK